MPKLNVGDRMPDFTYSTAFESGLSIGETVKKAGKTAVIFLRYYGCTLCQVEIHNYIVEYAKLTANGGQILVVLQSAPETIKEQLSEEDLPFEVICDPEQELYKMLDIGSMTEKPDVTDPAVIAKFEAIKNSGFQHGKYEGNEAQLPALFVLERDLTATHVHYGTWVGDTPSVDELAELL